MKVVTRFGLPLLKFLAFVHSTNAAFLPTAVGSLATDKIHGGQSASRVRVYSSRDPVSIGIGVGVLVAIIATGAAIVLLRKRGDAEEKKDESATAVETPESDSNADEYIHLCKAVARKMAQDVGPKLSKGGAVKNVLQSRMTNFTEKAKKFFVNEMQATAGAVMMHEDMQCEEAMLLFDWSRAVDSNFPPISILVAGVASPTLLNVMAGHHWMQAITVGLPMFCLCVAAIVVDWNSVCTIPTIFIWLYTQTCLAFLMFVGHAALLVKIYSGKKQLDAKSQEAQDRTSAAAADSESFSGMRDQVRANMVVLQEALLIENGIRHSVWNIIVGVATLSWVLTTVWNLVLIVGWTFVPGVVAFHPKAAEVAATDFCGAWMTVLVLRVSMLLSVLYLFLNLATVIQFICDMMIDSRGFSDAVLTKARNMDKNSMGFPIAEIMARAFLLRGSSDTLNSRLAVVKDQKSVLESERKEMEAKLESVRKQLDTAEKQEEALRKQAQDAGVLVDVTDYTSDIKTWREQGEDGLKQAEETANRVQEETAKQVEKLLEQISNTETFKALDQMAHEAYDTLNDPEFQEQMRKKLEEASAKTRALTHDALEFVQDPKNFELLQDAAKDAMDKATQAAAKVAEAANDPDLQAKLQKAAEEAYEAAQKASQDVATAVTDPEMQKKLKEASEKALKQVTEEAKALAETAQQEAEKLATAAQDPEKRAEMQKQLKEATEAAAQSATTAVQGAAASAKSAAESAMADKTT